MKLQSVLAVVSSVLLANMAIGSDVHDADRALETNLRQSLNQKHVHIDVHESIVTIEGEVRTEEDRQAIDAMVRGTPGVAAVKDKLRVKFPSPGTSTYAPTVGATPPAAVVTTPGAAVVTTTRIPVYTTEAPEVTTAPPVVNVPTPVVVPDFPKIKVQAFSELDNSTARRVASQLRRESLPATGLEEVIITIRNGNAIVRGVVDSREAHDALIATLQTGGGISAIYDRLQVR
jgi:osmotically-inducible protein OsmY